MKFCQKCGNELFDEAVICPKCGCKAGKSKAEKQKSGSAAGNTVAIILIIIGILCLLPAIGFFLSVL